MSQIRLPNGDIADTTVIVDPITGLPAAIGGGGGATTTAQTYYKATVASLGVSIDDVLINVQIINNANGSVIASTWSNATTGNSIASAPPSASISQLSDRALTDSQLEIRLRQICVVASDGELINPESCPSTLSYNDDGTLAYTQIQVGLKTYRQTLSWMDGALNGVSNWVLQ